MVEEVSDIAPGQASTDLYDTLLDGSDIRGFLDDLVARTATDLTNHEMWCGITLLRPKRAVTVAMSDPALLALDEAQYKAAQGPCLTAAKTGTTIYVPEVRGERRWPVFIQAIAAMPVRSIVAVPFPIRGDSSAALNLYSVAPNAFSESDIDGARFHALSTSKALQLALRIAELNDAREDLASAMVARTSIDIAVGIIMGQNRCDQETAVNVLKSASNGRQLKLRDVAEMVIGTVSSAGPTTHFEA